MHSGGALGKCAREAGGNCVWILLLDFASGMGKAIDFFKVIPHIVILSRQLEIENLLSMIVEECHDQRMTDFYLQHINTYNQIRKQN